ncbi:MAG TPA: hypothetical protein VMF53_03675 [Alphaproteobacteria bacterium]|nr:hypothetical protein [Alphaproteobacteria bacterium]
MAPLRRRAAGRALAPSPALPAALRTALPAALPLALGALFALAPSALGAPAPAPAPGIELAIYYGAYGEFEPLRLALGKPALAQPKILEAVCRSWSYATARVDGGTPPPGMRIDNGAISGTPAEAGTWVVSIRFAGIMCNGRSFPDQDTTVPIVVK